jgi:hypothetical protein
MPMMLWFLAAALAVRLVGIDSASIWFDEAISRYRASLSVADYFAHMSDYAGTNLWELLLRPFAYGPVWLLRIPPLIASIVALWLAWRIMDELEFTHAQRITAAIPLIFLPGLIWQAQDARYYASIGAIYMAGLWFAIGRRSVGLLACMGLLPYLHPTGPAYAFGLLVVATICGLGLVRGLRIGGLAFLSWLPRLYQIQSSQAFVGLQHAGAIQPGNTEFWLREVTPVYVIDQTAQALAVNTLAFPGRLLLFALILFVLAVGAGRIRKNAVRISLAAVLMPIIALLAMTIVQPVFFYRPVQPAAMPFCLLTGLLLAPRAGWANKIAPALALVLLVIGLRNWNPSARGGYINEGAEVIARNWQPGDRIAYASLTVAMPFQYYLPDRDSCLIPDNGMGELPPALRTMHECTGYSAPGTWLVWPRDPTLEAGLAQALERIVVEALPAWRSDVAWQFAPIEIYYLP